MSRRISSHLQAKRLLTLVGATSLWAGVLCAEDVKAPEVVPPPKPVSLAHLPEAMVYFDPLVEAVQDVAPVVPGVAPQTTQAGLGLSADVQAALNVGSRNSSTGSLAGTGASVERVSAAASPGGTGVVGGDQAQFYASTDAGDLFARASSGIEVQRRSPIANEARIRGYKLGEINTWSDGAFWFPARNDLDTFLSKIDSGNIRDAVILKGPYSPRLGPGFAFIDIVTDDTPRYRNGTEWHGRTTTNYKDNGEQIYGRQTIFGGGEDWGTRLSYGQRTGNDYTMGDGRTIPSSYNSRDVDFAYGYDPTPDSRIEFGYIRLDQTGLEFPGQVFDTNLLITDGWRARYLLNNQRYFDQLEVRGWYNQTSFKGDAQAYGKRQQIPELDASGFKGFTDGQLSSGGAQTAVTWGKANEVQWTVGTDYRYLSQRVNEFDSLFQIPCELNYPVPRTVQNTVGLFFENRNPVSNRLLLKFGGRVDLMNSNVTRTPPGFEETDCGCGCDHSQAVADALGVADLDRNFTLWLSYINAEYKLNENITLLSGVGFSMRPGTPTELYAVGPFLASLQQGFTSVIGNPNLAPEKLYQIDMGVRTNFERFRSGVNVFTAIVNDAVTFEAISDVQGKIVLAADNALQVRYINTGTAFFYGGELYAEYDLLDVLTPFATMNYVRVEDQTRGNRGNPLLGLPNPATEPFPNIAPIDVRMGLRFHEAGNKPNYGMDVIWRLVGDQDEFAASLGEQGTVGFSVWDVRAYWQLNQNLLVTAGMENVFDNFYREHLDLRTGLGVYQPGRTTYVGLELRY